MQKVVVMTVVCSRRGGYKSWMMVMLPWMGTTYMYNVHVRCHGDESNNGGISRPDFSGPFVLPL